MTRVSQEIFAKGNGFLIKSKRVGHYVTIGSVFKFFLNVFFFKVNDIGSKTFKVKD